MKTTTALAMASLLVTIVSCSSPDSSESAAGTSNAITQSQGVPAGLKCLATQYGGAAVQAGSGWALKFDDDTSFVWDDGNQNSYDTRLDNPTLKDTLDMPYTMGAASIVTEVNKDPGRIRHDGLFKKTLGGSEAEVKGRLVPVDFVGQSVLIHQKAADALGRVSARINALLADPANATLREFVTGELGGTFNWRVVVNTNRMSAHSYGLAIDMVVDNHSDYWEWSKNKSTGDFPHTWKYPVPQALVDAFEAEKFIWGGRWYHYDTMHFEYRPELFGSCVSSAKGAGPPSGAAPSHSVSSDLTDENPVPPAEPVSATTPVSGPSHSVGSACPNDDNACNPSSTGSSLICVNFQCVPGCRNDAQCPGNTICVGSQCL
jgi:hypothetical protein